MEGFGVGKAVALGVIVAFLGVGTEGAERQGVFRETNIRAGTGRSIVSVTSRPRRSQGASGRALAAYPHPRPRLIGFSPLVAISASDAQSTVDIDFEHELRAGYVGNPLVDFVPLNENFIVGFLDSGAVVDLVAGVSASRLGFSGQYVTQSPVPIEGVGGSVTAWASMPVGIFAAGLDAVSAQGLLDTTRLVGHTNVSAVVAPSILCDTGEDLTAVVGTALMAFHWSVIRVDLPRKVTVRGETFQSPDVQIIPEFGATTDVAFGMPMNFSGLSPVTTASYFPVPDPNDLETPATPTALSLSPLSIPLGGAFFAEMEVRRGESGPTRTMRVLVDTGAQSSIMSSGMAATLNVPFEPDFEVEVCGVGGSVAGVPGYYMDYVAFNGFGGPIEFSHAPFVVIDVASPDLLPLDGILGMNFFWNRNVVFAPSLLTSGFLFTSDPIAVAFGDNDVDFDVDIDDYQYFSSCVTDPDSGAVSPPCDHLDGDADGDVDLLDFARFQVCFSDADNPADPSCGEIPR